jgi:mannose-6-phosphate isomerase
VQLLPGEALQLGPGNLHAYLGGAGVELMGASDNVVRAGLTAKPIDVDTLLEVMDATPLLDPVMSAARVYPLAATSIRLLRLSGPAERRAKTHELFVSLSGLTGYLAPGAALDVASGDTVFVATA